MYGISPDRIKIRKAKYSLGMSAYLDWKSDYENGGIKYYDDESKYDFIFNKVKIKN